MGRKAPPEDGKHTVLEGEWVGSIAVSYGYPDWEEDVWRHSNNAELRQKRGDPHVLAAGDVLFIPPRQEKKESGAHEQKHRFKLKTANETLRLRILGVDGKPLKSEEYLLEIDCDSGAGKFEQQKQKTDGNGLIEEVVPSTSTGGILRFPAKRMRVNLRIGQLDPLDPGDKKTLIRGVQQRLHAIGFSPGDIDGLDGPRTRIAVQRFQQFCADHKDDGDPRITDAGKVTGAIDDKTRAALIKYYGC